jgi:FMN reductase
LKVVGLGGSLRDGSRSRAALVVALEGAAAAGAEVELLDLHQLGLPMYGPDREADPPAVVGRLIETCYEADGMLWSSPALHRQGECDDAAERVVEGSGLSD